jgi:hypothetical protein
LPIGVDNDSGTGLGGDHHTADQRALGVVTTGRDVYHSPRPGTGRKLRIAGTD